jgi:iron complex outermembrane receptor protein
MWTMTPAHRVWAATSRALRTPSLIDRGLHLEYLLAEPTPVSVVVAATGNPGFSSERFVNTEAGYRFTLNSIWSLDVVGFSGRYDDLQTFEPQPPVFEIVNGLPQMTVITRYENLMRADTQGAEVSSRILLRSGWQIDGAFSAFHLTSHPNGSQDPASPLYDGHAPSRQWRAHLAFPLFARGQGDLHLFRTGALRQLAVEPYTRLDARLEWALTTQLSAEFIGQNLLNAAHFEFRGHETNMQSTLIPRSVGLRLVRRF